MLNEEILKLKIKQAFDAESGKEVEPEQARDRIATAIAKAVIEQIKSAQIIVSGIVTVGSATTQTQTLPVTATIN